MKEPYILTAVGESDIVKTYSSLEEANAAVQTITEGDSTYYYINGVKCEWYEIVDIRQHLQKSSEK